MNPRLISRQSFVSTATSAAVVVALPRTSLFEPAAPAGIRLKSRPGKPKLSIALHGATQDHAVMTSHLAAFSETTSAAPRAYFIALNALRMEKRSGLEKVNSPGPVRVAPA